MSDLHPKAFELHDAIHNSHDDREWSGINDMEELLKAIRASRAYKEIKQLAADPTVLACYGSHQRNIGSGNTDSLFFIVPPLTHAIDQGKLAATVAILDIMNDPAAKSPILENLNARCADPPKHPFYIHYKSSSKFKFAHDYLHSPLMLRILKEAGYDLNMRESNHTGTSIYDSLIERINSDLTNGRISTKYTLAMIQGAGDAGVDPHGQWYKLEPDGPQYGLMEYTYRKLCNTAGIFGTPTHREGFTQAIVATFKQLAEIGVDGRKASSLPDIGSYGAEVKEQLLKYFKDTRKLYHSTNKHKDRKRYALAACAGGTFPELLADCADQDKHAGNNNAKNELLLSNLDLYWEREYRNIINATLARTAPVEKTALEKYLRNETPSGREV